MYLGLLTMLAEFGVGPAVVTMKNLDDRHYKQLNLFCVLLGVATIFVSALLAWPAGTFFRMPELPPILIVLSVSFLISSFRTLPYA